MLVLSRQVDEIVVIDGRVFVRVVALRDDSVDLAFNALPLSKFAFPSLRRISADQEVVTLELRGEVVIAETIKIVALKISMDKVRLGIDCPRELDIRRGEIDPSW